MIENLARVPVEVDYASEWRYRDPIVGTDTMTLVISQSGETADTIAAQREAKAKGSKTLAICNVVGSMITREAAGTIYTHAGPEIGVASTKAFTGQLTALYLFALYLAEVRGAMTPEQAKAAVQELMRIPGKLEQILTHDDACDELAKTMSAPRTSFSSDAAFTIPSRSKARSSSRKFPTFTPKVIRRAR